MADEVTKPEPRKKREGTIVVPQRNGGEEEPCFVMMPISDPEGYTAGHFLRIYEDIFRPAILDAGYRPVRADEDTASNLIHLSFLRQIREAPIAICDLSTRNGNVLYELGFRQAFDMPTVLVMEEGTPPLFDVASLRTYSYRRARLYHEVLEDQARIRDAILATVKAAEKSEGVYSLVRLLDLERPASRAELQEAESDPALQLVRAELAEMRAEIRHLANTHLPQSAAGATPSAAREFVLTLVTDSDDAIAGFVNELERRIAVGDIKWQRIDSEVRLSISTVQPISLVEVRKVADLSASLAGVTVSAVRFSVRHLLSRSRT